MKTLLKLSCVALLAAASVGYSADAQTARLGLLMRAKLDHSQKILEAVVTSNWLLLDRESRQLARAAEDPAWMALRTPEYIRHTEGFLRATSELTLAAERRDLEAASLAFGSLTTSCVSCHRYLARARIVDGGFGKR